jgi:long-subunit acyl-CoA synthetase (AMP-forming)
MNDSVVNRIAAGVPDADGLLRVVRLGATEELTLKEVALQAEQLAVGLAELGVRAGDRIGILAANSLEWVLLDLAALRLKAVTAGLEPRKFDPDGPLLERYGIKLLFTDQPADCPGVLPMTRVRELVAGADPAVRVAPASYRPDEPTTLKFTSGSTGVPKALAATAGSIDSSLRAVQQIFAHGPGDDLFVFLPLSLLQQRYWVYSALCFGHDVTISGYESALPMMSRVRPTVVMGVPGFYESARTLLTTQVPDGDPQALAEASQRLFGGRIRYLWTGSAPAARSTLDFFDGIGLPLLEGYGMNETCIVTKNHPGAHRPGSVGQVLPGKTVLIDEAGVISVRSEYPVADRYAYAPPGESARIFLGDGIVRTGDVGRLDADGFLWIEGRADDAIVLENGRKILVRPLEEQLRNCPDIEECVLFCVNQTALVAVVAPAGAAPDEAAIRRQLARVNETLAADERISRAVLAESGFSIGNGLLTSQFKPKRASIREAYRAEIDDPDRGIHAF